MQALDAYLAAGHHALHAHRELFTASVGLGCALYAEAVTPFFRSATDAFEMCVKIAFPRIRAADVVQFGPIRSAKIRRDEKRSAALAR